MLAIAVLALACVAVTIVALYARQQGLLGLGGGGLGGGLGGGPGGGLGGGGGAPMGGRESTPPPLRFTDLPALSPSSAFRKTDVGLGCKAGGCSFGLYAIGGGGATRITLSDHLAGGVWKATYRGVEFVNPVAIVGASMQTALVYDEKRAYNPTEAGCGRCDSFTGRSSSKILKMHGSGSKVYTSVQAAYFDPPGSEFKGYEARNTTVVSDTVISKRLEFVGENECDYAVEVRNPPQKHYFSLLEVLCSWCPRAACAQMYVLQDGWRSAPDSQQLYFANATHGLVMATSSGEAAMGVKLLDYPRGGRWEIPRYGTPESTGVWRKWSVTQRINPTKDPSYKIGGTPYVWRIRLYFGSLRDVQARMAQR